MKKFFVFCFAALIAAACEEQKVAPEMTDVKAGFPYTLTATIGNVDATPAVKANFTDPTPANPATAKWSVDWKVGDEIHVANQTGVGNSVAYVVKSISDGVATFELKEGEDVSKFTEATTFFAALGGIADDLTTSHKGVAPYLYNFNDAGEGGINIGLPSQKCVLPGSVDNNFLLAVSKASLKDGSLSFHFAPVVSYIRVTIPEGMPFDPGQFYFQSTVSGGSPNPSGFFRVRMNLNEDTIKEVGKRNVGGSPNAPFYYGTGSAAPTQPYPTMVAGVYYFPVIPGCTVKKLIIRDTAGADKITITFESPAFEAGKIYDFGSIPVPGPDFEAGEKIYVGGTGVDAVDADHHMSYLPKMNYHPDRTVATAFSDFCSWKNDQGTNFRSEFFNHWSMYHEEENPADPALANDYWASYFDYEIFVKLAGNADVYFYTKTDGGEPKAYAKIDGNYTWKADSPNEENAELIAAHIGGKSTVSFSAAPVAFQVPEDGIYRIRFSTATKEAYVSKAGDVIIRIWGPNGNGDYPLDYVGHGAWSKHFGDENKLTNGNNKNDVGSGYKFLFKGFDQDQPYGAQYPQGVTKVYATDPSQEAYSIVPVQGGPWGKVGNHGTFSTESLNFDNGNYKEATVSLFMNDVYGFYTHSLVPVNKE